MPELTPSAGDAPPPGKRSGTPAKKINVHRPTERVVEGKMRRFKSFRDIFRAKSSVGAPRRRAITGHFPDPSGVVVERAMSGPMTGMFGRRPAC